MWLIVDGVHGTEDGCKCMQVYQCKAGKIVPWEMGWMESLNNYPDAGRQPRRYNRLLSHLHCAPYLTRN